MRNTDANHWQNNTELPVLIRHALTQDRQHPSVWSQEFIYKGFCSAQLSSQHGERKINECSPIQAKMKIIVKNFFALILFVIQTARTARSKCNLHNGVADCSNTNLNQMPTLNNTNFIEVSLADFCYVPCPRAPQAGGNMKIISNKPTNRSGLSYSLFLRFFSWTTIHWESWMSPR